MAKVKNRYPCLRKRKRRNEIAVQKAREALAARRKELSKLLNNDASTSGTNMEKIGTFDKEVNKENTYFETGKNDGFVESNDDFTIQVEGSPASCDENKEANKENIYCQIGRNDASVATDEVLTIQFEGSPASCDENKKKLCKELDKKLKLQNCVTILIQQVFPKLQYKPMHVGANGRINQAIPHYLELRLSLENDQERFFI
ncbi:uncharacterized protein LOC125229136 [Leguminivora glycinivorella]|uniref:uncharacterized protein LOC125229136 n=1 Tax=Leguminivora glycinivorella TaxID=1035111 RepID=UPI00200EFB36|nr:uncharacterized protein LOC125229136 [Leguminivora glycinivorella]